MARKMVKVFLLHLIEFNFIVSGKIIKKMAKELKFSQMVLKIVVNGKLIKKMGNSYKACLIKAKI